MICLSVHLQQKRITVDIGIGSPGKQIGNQ